MNLYDYINKSEQVQNLKRMEEQNQVQLALQAKEELAIFERLVDERAELIEQEQKNQAEQYNKGWSDPDLY